jgi:hypothetical protein
MTHNVGNEGVEANARCLADRSQPEETRVKAGEALTACGAGEWLDLAEETRDELAEGILWVIPDAGAPENLRALAAKALRVPIAELSMEINEEVLAVLSRAIREGVESKRARLLAEVCQLVSASQVMKCEDEPLVKGLSDAAFEAVLLGKSTDDATFTPFADDAFGRARNRLNQLHGDWD